MGFEGTPLPEGLGVVALPAFVGVLLALGLLTVLRWNFLREWQLTLWTWGDIRRVWKRIPDESARTGGVILSHGVGLIGWGIAGSCFWNQMPWVGMGRGMALGAGVWVLRTLSIPFGKWLTLERELFDDFAELERHSRTGLVVLLSLGVLGIAVGYPTAGGWLEMSGSVLWIWGAWLVTKWLRSIQLLFFRRVDIGWGIAYICTLEIAPAVALGIKAMQWR